MLEVLYEDNHLIAINKRSGDIVQGDQTGDRPISENVKSYLKNKYKKTGRVFLGTIHRIDRPTSGIILFAKTSKALARMNKKFKNKEVKKTYWAIVEKIPEKKSSILTNNLKKNHRINKSFITDKKGKHAILEYKLIKKLKNYFQLEIKPKTGRHHQIRVQLAHIGCNIKGDIKYGAKRNNDDKSINLHARKIEFNHPVKKEKISIIAPVPSDKIWKNCKEP